MRKIETLDDLIAQLTAIREAEGKNLQMLNKVDLSAEYRINEAGNAERYAFTVHVRPGYNFSSLIKS